MSLLQASNPARPRILVINPNSTQAFSTAMQQAIRQDDVPVDFYTPSSRVSPPGIEGAFDSIVSAAGVLEELKGGLEDWDGFVVACFSAHPLVGALREIISAPTVSILDAPLLLASQISTSVGILTTSPRWVPLLEHDLHIQHATALCTAGVVSSGMSVLDLERLPRDQVLSTLGRIAREELVDKRKAGAIVLGCAGMVGLKVEVEKACGEGVRVIDPVECGVEVCKSLVRLGMKTSTVGMYA